MSVFEVSCFIYLLLFAAFVGLFFFIKSIVYQSPEEKEKWRKFDEKMAAHKKKMAAFEKDRKTNPVWRELDDFMDSMYKTPLYTTAPSSTYYATRGHTGMGNTTNKTQQNKKENNIPDYVNDPMYSYMPQNIYHHRHYVTDYVTDPAYSHLPCNIYHR